MNDVDLSFADASDASWAGARLWDARCVRLSAPRADFAGAVMINSDFSEADLTGAVLFGANLRRALFDKTTLIRADLRQTDMRETLFNRARLDQANFDGAKMGETVLAGVSLWNVVGLASIAHLSRSSIGFDTAFSPGGTPKFFLRDLGTPEAIADYAEALMERPITYYSCFISYSSTEDALARKLYSDLQEKGVRAFYAPEDLKIGSHIRTELDRSISVHDKLLLILSATSIASQWVEQEVESALLRERKEKRLILFPIRVDDAIFETKYGWAALVRNTRHIGDFRDWAEERTYAGHFARLARSLEMDAPRVRMRGHRR